MMFYNVYYYLGKTEDKMNIQIALEAVCYEEDGKYYLRNEFKNKYFLSLFNKNMDYLVRILQITFE